jgi:hypothetical protein
VPFHRAADVLTTFRAICGLVLPFRPSLVIFLAGVVSDWLDGPLARRSGASVHGAAFDIEADSLLTLGAAAAAIRCGAPAAVLVGPVARYVIAPARGRDERWWDRLTGVAQMALLGAAIARLPTGWPSVPVTAARCAALLARVDRSR